MKVIALSGWKGSGKDTVANYLIEKYNTKRVAFADPLKDMVSKEYDIPREWMDDPLKKESPLLQYPVNPQDGFSEMLCKFMAKELRTKEGELDSGQQGLFETFSRYNGILVNPRKQLYWTPRALCILKGSSNRSVDSSFWVTQAIKSIYSQSENNKIQVITDMRYKSELKQLKDAFGEDLISIRIHRYENSTSSDPSERDLDDVDLDFDLLNSGDLQETYKNIDMLMSQIGMCL